MKTICDDIKKDLATKTPEEIVDSLKPSEAKHTIDTLKKLVNICKAFGDIEKSLQDLGIYIFDGHTMYDPTESKKESDNKFNDIIESLHDVQGYVIANFALGDRFETPVLNEIRKKRNKALKDD